jgi:hypothetical protein
LLDWNHPARALLTATALDERAQVLERRRSAQVKTVSIGDNGPEQSGVFDALAQSPKLLNPEGEEALDDILTDPDGTTFVGDNVVDIFGDAGRGTRFRAHLTEPMRFLEIE